MKQIVTKRKLIICCQFSLFLDEKAFFYVCQNLFLEMKKLEIEETKVTYFVSVLRVVYWDPFLGLHDLIKTSQIFPRAILCPRPF